MGVDWKANGLRHSFISYRCATTKNLPAVAMEAGNSVTVINKHYRELTTEAEGKAWFAIVPHVPVIAKGSGRVRANENGRRQLMTEGKRGSKIDGSDALQGFMIAGADKKFVWADAQISGDTIVVSSKEVAQPAAVRYAWSNAFQLANLFNKDGLPAQSFRTDEW
jgi:hypothetical protein